MKYFTVLFLTLFCLDVFGAATPEQEAIDHVIARSQRTFQYDVFWAGKLDDEHRKAIKKFLTTENPTKQDIYPHSIGKCRFYLQSALKTIEYLTYCCAEIRETIAVVERYKTEGTAARSPEKIALDGLEGKSFVFNRGTPESLGGSVSVETLYKMAITPRSSSLHYHRSHQYTTAAYADSHIALLKSALDACEKRIGVFKSNWDIAIVHRLLGILG